MTSPESDVDVVRPPAETGVPEPRYPWHSAPPPVPAAVSGRDAVRGQRAGFVTRALANAADACVVLVALGLGYAGVAGFRFLLHPASFHFPAPGFPALLLIGSLGLAAYFTATWAIPQRTYGDQLMGLRVVGRRGTRLHWSHAALRAILCIVFPLGLLWIVVSPHNRSVQDVLLRTAVVYD